MRKQLTIIWDGRFSMKSMKTIEKESSLIIFFFWDVCKLFLLLREVSVYGRCMTINENLREVNDHLTTRGKVCDI